jgi:hypothetical protein
MNWDTHINNITSKANKIIGFLRRNLPIQNTETKTLAYKFMVRSNLEYCASLWSPHDMSVPVHVFEIAMPRYFAVVTDSRV